MIRSTSVLALVCATLAFAAAPARAVVINFTLSGDTEVIELTPSAQDATVTLESLTDSVDLTPGIAETVFINAGDLDVFQGATSTGSGTLSQTLTINSPAATPTSRSISQGVTVDTYAANPPFENATADIFLTSGTSVTFDLGQFELTVTPESGQRTGQTSTSIPFSNNATFLLTQVPEPTAGLALIGGAALLIARRRARAR